MCHESGNGSLDESDRRRRFASVARRRWFQFRLRTLLIAPFLLALAMWLWFHDSTPQVPQNEYAVLNATLHELGFGGKSRTLLLNRTTLQLPNRKHLSHVLREVAEVDETILDSLYSANESVYTFARRFDSQFDCRVTTLETGRLIIQDPKTISPHWVELSRPAFNKSADVAVVYFGLEYGKFTWGTNVAVLTKQEREWLLVEILPVY